MLLFNNIGFKWGGVFGLLLVGQGLFSQDFTRLRHATTESYKMDFYILLEDKKIRYQDTLTYYWFKAQKLHKTQGHSSGNLLHGSFSKYYISGQLAEYGQFDFGLRSGEWTTWYDSGQIKTIEYYKNGILHGRFKCYDEVGNIIEQGHHKKGEKKLKVKAMESDSDSLDTMDESWFKKMKGVLFLDDYERGIKREEKKRKRENERKERELKKEARRKEQEEKEG